MSSFAGSGNRIIGLDIVRTFAIFSVIAGHFFVLHTPFMKTEFHGTSMFLQSMAFSLCLVGVSLFIMLTGYLNCNKIISKDYYKSGTRVLASYLIFAVVTLLFDYYYLGKEMSLYTAIDRIFRFNAVPYGWYIEMWIGLFLLTPFLNVLYKALPTKKQKSLLIIVLFFMTILPNTLNRQGFHFIPDFWSQCYPLTLFFIGSFIAEYKPKFKVLNLIIVIILLCLISPISNLFYNFIGNHIFIEFTRQFCAVTVILAICVFILLYQLDIECKFIRKSFTKIAYLSLDMYLCSYLFDKIYYPCFIDKYFESQSQFGKFCFIIVPLVFFSSLLVAMVKDFIFKFLKRIY